MHIENLKIPGTFLIANDIHLDNRGSFENLFRLNFLENLKNEFEIRQVNLSRNQRSGTLRGLHFQKFPSRESKIVSCIDGKIFDVLVDIRPESKFYGCWQAVILEPNQNSIFIPEGVAHGFQTLSDDCVVQYLHSGDYASDLSGGIRFDDPDVQITWPRDVTAISENDTSLPFLKELRNYL
jgi:dTDP-4-dehydrorhamnose 3,5-epimerase